MHSAIYEGWVRHRRFSPTEHEFRYRVYMMYLDLQELGEVLSINPLWSSKPWALARFRREDFYGDSSVPLDAAVRGKVESETGWRPDGAIRLLSNWRYWGYSINPISCYYCFDRDENLRAILTEVTNTPWNQRHAYVLPCDPNKRAQRIQFYKQMHVSPFNPMNIRYDWKSTTPAEQLTIHLRDLLEGECNFDATLRLHRRSLSSAYMTAILLRYPFMTIKVAAGIYWNAMKLLFKRTPLFANPTHKEIQQ